MLSRGLRVVFAELSVEVEAVMLDQLAPRTCQWVWDLLAKPLENELWHTPYLGPALTCRYSLPHPSESLPRENLTVTPVPGDLIFVNFTEATGRSRGMVAGLSAVEAVPTGPPGTFTGFDLFYGPDGRMFIPMGWFPGCNFARVVRNLEGLARVAGLTRLEGVKKVRFSRVEL